MKELEDRLHRAPSLGADSKHEKETIFRALHAYQEQQKRGPVILPFVASFLGAAAALAIAAVLFWPSKEMPQLAEADLSREAVVKAYVDLVDAFPDGLAALAFVDGEMQIYPGRFTKQSVEPTYVEMMVGTTHIKVVAAEGTTLPLEVNGVIISIEVMPDISGRPTVSGEDFYWSTSDYYLPPEKKVLEAEKLELFL